ncbi:MAG: cupin domain-containing protein [Armatimonadetes bacterium]|nr:cupin domain-containing protein [Armatimonadota bacterium]
MTLELETWDEARHGPLSEAAFRRKLKAEGYSVSRYVYPPGTHFPDHQHDVDKKDAVLAGRFLMRMHGQEIVLEAGDCLTVPCGAVHSATVVGEVSVISLDAIRR